MKWYRIQALLMKYWYISTNSLDRIFDIFYWPIIGIMFFGFTSTFLDKVAKIPSLLLFLLGGLILWNLFQRIQQDVSVYIMEDFWSRNVANSFITPLKESELFISVSLFGIIRAFLSFLIMTIISIVAYQFNIYTGGVKALLFAIPLFLFAWGLGIFVIGLIFRFGMRIQVFAWSISMLLQPIAAVSYPIDVLPLWMQKVALGTPLYYTFEGFRQAYQGNFSLYFLGMAFALSLVYLVIGYFLFVQSVKRARRTGLITLY